MCSGKNDVERIKAITRRIFEFLDKDKSGKIERFEIMESMFFMEEKTNEIFGLNQ